MDFPRLCLPTTVISTYLCCRCFWISRSSPWSWPISKCRKSTMRISRATYNDERRRHQACANQCVVSLVPRLLPSFCRILYKMRQKAGRSLGTKLCVVTCRAGRTTPVRTELHGRAMSSSKLLHDRTVRLPVRGGNISLLNISCIDHTYRHSSKKQNHRKCQIHVFPPQTRTGEQAVLTRMSFDGYSARPVQYLQKA